MRSLTCAAVATTLFAYLGSAQTSTKCNPIQQQCPADPALGRSIAVDFTSGSSSDFTYTGSGNEPTYDSNGASFTVAKSGDNPQITSKWYIMFGHVEIVMKTAPGVGMVSSAILQSDDLDEIDWEILGASPDQAQTNYFSKGQNGGFNRGTFVSDPGSQTQYNTYAIDWTAEQTTWSVNGVTVRTLTAASTAGYGYPQSPMFVRLGAWAGGDPSNPAGTVQWAGGPINYAAGPYTMSVKSVSVQDYSTGTSYTYDGTSGSWQSIKAAGGSVNPAGTPGSEPTATAAYNYGPATVSGNYNQGATSVGSHTGWPWVTATYSTTQATGNASPFSQLYTDSATSVGGAGITTSPSVPSPSPSSYSGMTTYPIVRTPPAKGNNQTATFSAPTLTGTGTMPVFTGAAVRTHLHKAVAALGAIAGLALLA